MQVTPEATATFPVARWAGWNTGDLIWSLWLSSLVVGYSTIVSIIGQPAVAMAMVIWRSRTDPLSSARTVFLLRALIFLVAAFILAFFTVHFGGFHYVHSQLLLHFSPIDAAGSASRGWAGKAGYLEIFRRYWIFLPSAFISHRAAFQRKPLALDQDRLLNTFAEPGNKTGHLRRAVPERHAHARADFLFLPRALHGARELRGVLGDLRRLLLSVAPVTRWRGSRLPGFRGVIQCRTS